MVRTGRSAGGQKHDAKSVGACPAIACLPTFVRWFPARTRCACPAYGRECGPRPLSVSAGALSRWLTRQRERAMKGFLSPAQPGAARRSPAQPGGWRQGMSNSAACREVGINRRTDTRWRYGRKEVDQVVDHLLGLVRGRSISWAKNTEAALSSIVLRGRTRPLCSACSSRCRYVSPDASLICFIMSTNCSTLHARSGSTPPQYPWRHPRPSPPTGDKESLQRPGPLSGKRW
jgi:hypothetical protein